MADRRHLAALLICGLLSTPLPAHTLKVFAAAEGERILGEAYFVGGAPAVGAVIRIMDSGGHELARLQPDGQGQFDYRVDRRMSYRVVADSLDGHRASWTVGADELSPRLPEPDQGSTAPGSGAAGDAGAAEPIAGNIPQCGLEDAVERAMARQVKPLREELRAHEERVRFRDVLGGLGYIVGLAGLGVWLNSRRGGQR